MNDLSDTTSGDTGTTWVYTYDRGGNILNKKRYAYTTGTVGDVLQTITYTYGDSNWKDKMTKYGSTAITYDVIGNPVTYGSWTYTWEKGRQLKKMEHTNGTIVEFAYNSEGLRVSKTVTNTSSTVTTTQYTLHGSNLVHLVKGNKYMHFWYDAQNRPTIVNYNGTKYAYILNLQGDVLGLVDSNGDEVVRYSYNAWGKVLSTTGSLASSLGALNPFRYRGYIYDTEIALYYIRSRYYNPTWQKFINADVLIKGNLFCYCSNSPIVLNDHDGYYPDITEVFLGALHDAEKEFSKHHVFDLSENNLHTILSSGTLKDYLWFAIQMDHKAPWDIKEKECWKRMFPTIPQPTKANPAILDGKIVDSHKLGNIAYGYLGTCMGMSPQTLFAGGGFAKKYHEGFLDGFDFSKVGDALNYILSEWAPYWGDDKDDHEEIKFGIFLYYKYGQ